MKEAVKGLGLKVLGWVLLVAGIILMPAPGPGAMVILLAMVVLATQYEWADKRLDKVKVWALKGAADSVKTWPRIIASLLGVAWLVGLGIFWGMRPPAPDWWPLRESWWLIGGWGTGSTLIFSGVVAFGLLVYSFVKLRGATKADIEAQATRGGASDAPGVQHDQEGNRLERPRPADSASHQ
ncbi:PGPGW domain-containing protein [Nocardioides aurantiacus]|uniref:Uncharacterized protein (TIGR02611 family) n=1 Tax=Nocardioides aurantiacus TaxID=86796 RepID=A0A3N2CSQ8_9ACTN|nr:PGPGW domain-containing protein [Nocardioides aurantiacus]ROR90535.1 uncharacterized protein (TIGR02611 family) [Nocardioides aurantiacus]